MVWRISFDSDVEHDLKKLDNAVQKRVINYLKVRVSGEGNPRQYGKPLKGKLSGIWRYRVGDYRILCQIREKESMVLVLRVRHRKRVYQ